MASTGNFHVGMMRSVLRQAGRPNARMVAAAIGGHLSRLGDAVDIDGRIGDAIEDVRDSTFDLLTALSRDDGVVPARQSALEAVDRLQTSLSAPVIEAQIPAGRLPSMARIRQAFRFMAAKAPSMNLGGH